MLIYIRRNFYFFFFAYESIQNTMKIIARITTIPRTALNAPETRWSAPEKILNTSMNRRINKNNESMVRRDGNFFMFFTPMKVSGRVETERKENSREVPFQ